MVFKPASPPEKHTFGSGTQRFEPRVFKFFSHICCTNMCISTKNQLNRPSLMSAPSHISVLHVKRPSIKSMHFSVINVCQIKVPYIFYLLTNFHPNRNNITRDISRNVNSQKCANRGSKFSATASCWRGASFAYCLAAFRKFRSSICTLLRFQTTAYNSKSTEDIFNLKSVLEC